MCPGLVLFARRAAGRRGPFRAGRPEVVVELREAAWTDPSGGLADGAVDVAFLRPPVDAAGVALEPLPLAEYRAGKR